MHLDLKDAKLGAVQVCNTPERVEELTAEIDKVLADKTLSRRDGERLRGRLHFSNAQLFGRTMKQSLRDLGKHITSGRKALADPTIEAQNILQASLSANKLRLISGKLSDHVHIYVDASYDPDGFTRIGGLCVNSSGEVLGFFSEEVPQDLIEEPKSGSKETVIMEFEMLAIALAVNIWTEFLRSCRVVLFTDSEAVRSSLLKGSSSNKSVDLLTCS